MLTTISRQSIRLVVTGLLAMACSAQAAQAAPEPPSVIDNASPNFSKNGTWTSKSGGYDGSYLLASGSNQSTLAKWTLSVTNSGRYRVYLRWPSQANAADRAPVEVQFTKPEGGNALDSTRRVNQRVNANTWQYIGSYYFKQSSTNYVALRASDDGTVAADAVRLELTDQSVPALPDPDDLPTGLTAREEFAPSRGWDTPEQTDIVWADAAGNVPAHFELRVNGSPYFVKGACGHEALGQVAAAGANTIRTYDAAMIDEALLKTASDLNMKILVGINMAEGTTDYYTNKTKRLEQRQRITDQVARLKKYKAILGWSIGNEIDPLINQDGMTEAQGKALYDEIEYIANHIRQVDHWHFTTTVHAGAWEEKMAQVNDHAPHVDMVSFNTYVHLPETDGHVLNYGSSRWRGPYMITEFSIQQPSEHHSGTGGPTPWGSTIEPTSGQKYTRLIDLYNGSILNKPLLVGSFYFKGQHAFKLTPTWYPLIDEKALKEPLPLPPDSPYLPPLPTPQLDAMRVNWSGPASPDTLAARIATIKIDGQLPASNVVVSGTDGNIVSMIAFEDLPAGVVVKDDLQISVDIRQDTTIKNKECNYPEPIKPLVKQQDTLEPRRWYIPKNQLPDGLYRLYYTVRRKTSNGEIVSVSTANTPFCRVADSATPCTNFALYEKTTCDTTSALKNQNRKKRRLH